MIIFGSDAKRPNQLDITAIAAILFNMESGKEIFNIDGTFNNEQKDFNNIRDPRGITYNVVGMKGTICIIQNDLHRSFIHELSQLIDESMDDLDDRYFKEYGYIENYNVKSTDFTLVTDRRSLTNISRRHFSINSSFSVKDKIEWRLHSDVKSLFAYEEDVKLIKRDKWEFENLLIHNTLIIDLNRSILQDNSISIKDTELKINDFSICKNIATHFTVIYSPNHRNIDCSLRKLFIGDPSISDTCSTIPYPIYDESWENITPMRVYNNIVENAYDSIINLLKSKHNYKEQEQEEKKNTEYGFASVPNDTCVIC